MHDLSQIPRRANFIITYMEAYEGAVIGRHILVINLELAPGEALRRTLSSTFTLRALVLVAIGALLLLYSRHSRDTSSTQQLYLRNGVGIKMKQRIVHLDLKGAPPKPEIYTYLLPLFRQLNFTGVLMEYEDMFPYSGQLAKLSLPYAYNESMIGDIQRIASENSLEVIPLVQTFGHLEYALKHEEFASLRELADKTDSICPSDTRSIALIKEMLRQVRHLHPRSKAIHMGADEAWWVGQDARCTERLANHLGGSFERLKLAHISRSPILLTPLYSKLDFSVCAKTKYSFSIASFAKHELGFERVLVWNDMFDKSPISLMKEYRMHELVVPVVWGYVEDVNAPGYFADGMFERYSQVFNDLMLAGAYKGANGENQQFMAVDRYLTNLNSYHRLTTRFFPQLNATLSGIILTGWQRYSHDRGLCELLPIGIPSLAKEALFLEEWQKIDDNNPPDYSPKLLELLKCPAEIRKEAGPVITYNGHTYQLPELETKLCYCNFFGSDLFKELENLRVIAWKSTVNPNFRSDQQLMTELDQLRERIKPILSKYFYDETVKEWMKSYLDPSKAPFSAYNASSSGGSA